MAKKENDSVSTGETTQKTIVPKKDKKEVIAAKPTPPKKRKMTKPAKNKSTVSNPVVQERDPSKFRNDTPPGMEEVHVPTLLSNEEREHLEKTYTPPKQVDTKLEFGSEMKKIILTGGTLTLTDAQNKALFADFKDEEVAMKPDGTIYVPWIRYSSRLTQLFGGTGWVLIPEGMPKENNNVIYWGFHLMIKGIYCGFSIGEQQYFNNGRMTYGEACEGAKSNSLTRLCKGMGIGIKLWDKNYANQWLEKYAVFNWQDKDGKNKKIYTLKSELSNGQNTNQDQGGPKKEYKEAKKHPVHPAPPVTHQNPDTEIPAPDIVENFRTRLKASTSFAQLQEEYGKVKLAWSNGNGTITTAQKEELRILANDLAERFQNGG